MSSDRDPAAPPLAGALLRAADWFNAALLARLTARGWPRLSRSQSEVFAVLPGGGARPAALARDLGMTRQSMHSLLRGLADEGLVALVPDPQDQRALLVQLTAAGAALRADAREILDSVEAELAGRIGQDAVAGLRDALARGWGEPPLAE